VTEETPSDITVQSWFASVMTDKMWHQ